MPGAVQIDVEASAWGLSLWQVVRFADLPVFGLRFQRQPRGTYGEVRPAPNRERQVAGSGGAFDSEHEYGNSHAPMLDVYKRMLDAYRPIWSDLVEGGLRGRDGFILTSEEVAEVVQARRYPR